MKKEILKEAKTKIATYEKNEKGETRRRPLKKILEELQALTPFFYDENKNFWIFDFKLSRWQIVDETDILNLIRNLTSLDTFKSSYKNEIIESVKQIGREYKPKEPPKTWIQFKNNFIDFKTGEKFLSTPEWFAINPINRSLSNETNTPVIDSLLESWVGKEKIILLKEIIAYCLIPDYPLARLFFLLGEGANGKTTYQNLIERFLGNSNCCTTTVRTLISSRFESTKLYKKLLCIISESQLTELNETDILKSLSGGGKIRYEFKGKEGFEDFNYAKVIISANTMPDTKDKTNGWYRRLIMIDFNNVFSIDKDILLSIPENEYDALATQCTAIIRELINRGTFTNEGTTEEKAQRFEEYANPLDKFLKEKTIEDFNGTIFKWKFKEELETWCKNNKCRKFSDREINNKMKEKGCGEIYKLTEFPESEMPKQWRAWTKISWK
jgi:putative DNA primase/helicase